MRKQWFRNDYLIVLVAGILLTIPINFQGLFTSHDFNIHFKWSYLFAEQLLSGELYPRWLAKDFAGYGSPVFFYYGPVPFYFSSFFYLLFHSIAPLWIPITLAASFSIIASGLACYFWLKSFTSPNISVVGSILYMIMPYHLGIALYTRFAYAECWSFVWMPLILLFCTKIVENKLIKGFGGISLSLSLLLMTHLPSALIFLPFPIFYLLIYSKKIRAWIALGLSYVMGFVISALYWIPAIAYQDFTNFSAILKYSWRDNLLFHNPNNVEGSVQLWYYLNLSTLFLFIVALALLYQILVNSKSERRDHIFFGGAFIVSVFMVTPLSIPIWLFFKPLQVIGFPWRFLSIFSLFFTGLVSLYFTIREKEPNFNKTQKKLRIKGILILGLLMLGTNFLFVVNKVKESKDFVQQNQIPNIRIELLDDFKPAEHIPANADLQNLPLNSTEMIEVVEGSCNVTLIRTDPRLLQFTVYSQSNSSKIRINQFDFPGWTISGLSSEKVKLSPDKSDGLLYILVSKGTHSITLSLKSLPVEYYSKVLSAMGVVAWISILLYYFVKRLPFRAD